MNDITNMPPEGTPEYDEMMRTHYGENYEFGFRIGFGKRLLAHIIDFIILAIIGSIVMAMMGYIDILSDIVADFMATQDFTVLEDMETALDGFTPVSILIYFLYYSLEIFMGASIGKLALSLKIGNEDRTEASTNTLFKRYIIKHSDRVFTLLGFIAAVFIFNLFSSLLLIALVVGFFFTLSVKRQAFHDSLSKTAVFHKNNFKQI